jgi:hypothetical protein
MATPSSVPPQAGANGAQTKNGRGGIHLGGPTLSVTKNVTTTVNGAGAAATGNGGKGGVPGADFMSNEDIRAFCEYLRKDARNRATERAMDADHLEAVLRTIPGADGSRSGSRARARRVSRWLKKVAAAEKAIQKYSASVYATFEREYEAELRKIGRGRVQQRNVRAPFGWK